MIFPKKNEIYFSVGPAITFFSLKGSWLRDFAFVSPNFSMGGIYETKSGKTQICDLNVQLIIENGYRPTIIPLPIP